MSREQQVATSEKTLPSLVTLVTSLRDKHRHCALWSIKHVNFERVLILVKSSEFHIWTWRTCYLSSLDRRGVTNCTVAGQTQCIAAPSSCRAAPNSAQNKLHQIYCVCLRKNILLTFFSYLENFGVWMNTFGHGEHVTYQVWTEGEWQIAPSPAELSASLHQVLAGLHRTQRRINCTKFIVSALEKYFVDLF